ncbi:receptor-type tyrosine-protein phosphatase alpha-like [Haliotis rufescens]|uniref:receptor-type tyrosine-protein phosphatase alpha-like n=1 Tax=Haliotis rufescens TaxID=6454 RepID=UPI00201EBC9B|nr:receptor-type tyrosine-protein phosphatase alpha-like [Haliotis rufescens]
MGTAIPVSELEVKVRGMVERPEEAEDEFQGLPGGFIHTHQESQLPENKGKNRFKGYYPYDYNRVVLHDDNSGGGGDYINASYVDGYDTERRYIAAQGPYRLEIVDNFWGMIWQDECRIVVMVTGLIEAGKMKCLRYWPEKGTETYGDISVTMDTQTRFANYTVTKLSVQHNQAAKKLCLEHFHFTSWPDHGVPDTSALLEFIRKVKVTSREQTQTIIVHCSAGIGRTGTYIAIERLMEQAKTEGVVDVVSVVSNMRGQRKNMIQTKEQYLFVYQAMAMWLSQGDTSLDSNFLKTLNLDDLADVTMGNKTVQQHLEALHDNPPRK